MRTPILLLHICGGVVGLLSAAVAISFRKGSPAHRMAGHVFVVSMMIMGACVFPLALMKHDMNNLFGGFLTMYLVGTAWLTVRRSDGNARAGLLDWAGGLFALAIGSLIVIHGWQKATGQVADDGTPTFMSFFMGSIVLLAAAGDFRVMLRGVSGRARIARHLWRMCFGWFIASGSFFLGPNNRPLRLLRTIGLRQPIFRTLLRDEVLLALAVLPLLLLIFWMIRVRFMRAYSAKPSATTVPVPSLAMD
jgi:uncharacterized membrane protein